jgi:hypothetical protein
VCMYVSVCVYVRVCACMYMYAGGTLPLVRIYVTLSAIISSRTGRVSVCVRVCVCPGK